MTNTCYVIVEEATGLVDGYYDDPKLAAAMAVYWTTILGSKCVEQPRDSSLPIPESPPIIRNFIANIFLEFQLQ